MATRCVTGPIAVAISHLVVLWLMLLGATSACEGQSRPAVAKTARDDLYQLGLAMHKYLAAQYRPGPVGALRQPMRFPPPAIYSEEGKPLLSWRVLILRYLGEEELFRQFKFDEPWDSPHNRALVEKIPRVYQSVRESTTKVGYTHYQVFVGKGTMFDGPEGMDIGHVTDRTAKTILIVEAAEAVPWTKPADIVYSSEKPLPKFGASAKDGFHAVFADGHPEFLRNDDERDIRAAITPDAHD